jgi:hypothetical protein
MASPVEDALNNAAEQLAYVAHSMGTLSLVVTGALLFGLILALIWGRKTAKIIELLVKNHYITMTSLTLWLMKRDGFDPKDLKKDMAQLHDFLLEGDKKPTKRHGKKRKKKKTS